MSARDISERRALRASVVRASELLDEVSFRREERSFPPNSARTILMKLFVVDSELIVVCRGCVAIEWHYLWVHDHGGGGDGRHGSCCLLFWFFVLVLASVEPTSDRRKPYSAYTW